MAITRAKTISPAQFDFLIERVRLGPDEVRLRDEVALRLSFYAGLRAGEIGKLRWDNNLLKADGRTVARDIHITSDVGKRAVERVIPMEPDLAKALRALRKARPDDVYVFHSAVEGYHCPEQAGRPSGDVTTNAVAQWFRRLYKNAGLKGASSHSGRRTFITERARAVGKPEYGNLSIQDVRILAGHNSLATTQSYVEASPEHRRLVCAWPARETAAA